MTCNTACALARKRDERAFEPLIATLRDEDGHVRSRAAFALGKLDTEQAVATLIRTFQDNDAEVRGAAVKALAKLRRGKPLELDADGAH